MAEHEGYIEDAVDALEQLANDNTVSPMKMRESLESMKEFIDLLLEGVG